MILKKLFLFSEHANKGPTFRVLCVLRANYIIGAITLKMLPQKPEAIVIEQIIEHLSSIGAIHNTQANLNPG